MVFQKQVSLAHSFFLNGNGSLDLPVAKDFSSPGLPQQRPVKDNRTGQG